MERDDKRALGRPNRVGGAKRLRRSRWECGPRQRGAREGVRPAAGCGWVPHESGRPCSTRRKAVREQTFPFLTENRGTLKRNTKPFGSRPGEKGTRTRTGRTETGRTAVGRAGSFNPEEPRSSRFRSYGPSLREERLRSHLFISVVGAPKKSAKMSRVIARSAGSYSLSVNPGRTITT